MYPFQDQPGIFYAPAYLANKNPDEFVGYKFSGGGGLTLTMEQYGIDANGNSFRYEEPRFRDSSGREYEVIGNQAYLKGQTLTGTPIPVQPSLDVQPRFLDTMYAQSFGDMIMSQSAGFQSRAPGDSLAHWRAIHQSILGTETEGVRQVVLLEYYTGYRVEGTVFDGLGMPQEGVQVTFMDGFGASHDLNVTGQDGKFSVLAPFSQDGDLALTVRVNGQTLYSQPFEVSREEAAGGSVAGVRVDLPLSGLEGMAYRDMDKDGAFNASTDQVLAGVEVKLGNRTVMTDADGRYSIPDHPAGVYSVSSYLPGYQNTTASVTLAGANATTHDFVLSPLPAQVTLQFSNAGEIVPGAKLSLEGAVSFTDRATNADGNLTVSLPPGEYTVSVDDTTEDAEGNEIVYNGRRVFDVPFGGEPLVIVVENGST